MVDVLYLELFYIRCLTNGRDSGEKVMNKATKVKLLKTYCWNFVTIGLVTLIGLIVGQVYAVFYAIGIVLTVDAIILFVWCGIELDKIQEEKKWIKKGSG